MTKQKNIIGIIDIMTLLIISFIGFSMISVHALETCVTYDSVKDVLTMKCDMSLTQLSDEVNDPSKIVYLGNGEWILNTTIYTVSYTTFSINSKNENISWLKINKDNGVVIRGRLEIDGIKITSWNSTTNETISQNENVSIPRGYIYVYSSSGGWISDSDIGYLGYKTDKQEGTAGISFYDSYNIILSNNRFHDNYFAFYSDNSYNITIDNNVYYHNILYAIDPHTDSHNFRIINNHVRNNYKFGIIFSLRCYNFLIENNTVHDNNEGKTGISYGIFASRISRDNIVRNNTIYNETIGIDLSQSSNNEVYDNKIFSTDRAIFIVSGSEGKSTNNYVHDNEIKNSKTNIVVRDSKGNRIINNTNSVVGTAIVNFNNEEKYSISYNYNRIKIFLNNIFETNYSGNNKIMINGSVESKKNYSDNNETMVDGSVESGSRKNSTVIITFDDGSKTVYDNAFPILKANNQKAVNYIIISRPDKAKNYMNWSVLKELYDLGWDISSHTVNHVDLRTVNDLRLNYELNTSLNTLISKGFKRSAKFIAYPFGGYNNNVTNATKANGYVTGRSTMRRYMTGSTKLTKNNDTLYTMTVFEVFNTTSIEDTENAINETIKNNRNLIIVYHVITSDKNTSKETQTNLSNFKIISDYIASRNSDISAITMSEYYNSIIAK